MIRTIIAKAALIAGLLAASEVLAGPVAAAQEATQVTAADAASFIGEWTLSLQGPNGGQDFDLTVKVDKDKVVGEITDANATRSITDVSKADKSLVLRYSFDYQGTPVPTVVSLTPAPDDKTKAQIDFAGGAYIMTGSATKKEKAKPPAVSLTPSPAESGRRRE